MEQNIVLRWVSDGDLPELHAALEAAGLADPGAGTILDVAACPGTDTCKLGIASSRGLAAELRTRLAATAHSNSTRPSRSLRIKISGCFNSCGQHHVADLGFYGVSRNKGGYAVPHFQVVLGGAMDRQRGVLWPGRSERSLRSEFRRWWTASPAATSAERARGETFQAFIARIGKAECKKTLEDLMARSAAR